MDNNKKPHIKDIAHSSDNNYYKNTKEGEVDEKVTKILEKIKNTNLSPQKRTSLGLDKNWQTKVSSKFVEKVIITAESHKKAFKELARY